MKCGDLHEKGMRLAAVSLRCAVFHCMECCDEIPDLLDSYDDPEVRSSAAVVKAYLKGPKALPRDFDPGILEGPFLAYYNAIMAAASDNYNDVLEYHRKASEVIERTDDDAMQMAVGSLTLGGIMHTREDQETADMLLGELGKAADKLRRNGDEGIIIVFARLFEGITEYISYCGSEKTVADTKKLCRALLKKNDETIPYGLRSIILYRLGLLEL